MFVSNFLFTSFLEPNENIELVCHTHIWTFRHKMTKDFLLGIVAPVIFYFLFPPLFLFWAAWAIVGIMRFLFFIIGWYYDAWLVTDIGVISIQWEGFFNRSSNRVEYHTIDGIAYQIQGFFASILGYGSVQLQHLGGTTLLELKNAVNPKKVERYILRLQDTYLTSKNMREHQALKDLLAGMVQTSMKK